MNMMPGIGALVSPTHSPSDYFAHESECRDALKPWLAALLDTAVSAGWSRRTAASTLMFLAAQQVAAAAAPGDGKAQNATAILPAGALQS